MQRLLIINRYILVFTPTSIFLQLSQISYLIIQINLLYITVYCSKLLQDCFAKKTKNIIVHKIFNIQFLLKFSLQLAIRYTELFCISDFFGILLQILFSPNRNTKIKNTPVFYIQWIYMLFSWRIIEQAQRGLCLVYALLNTPNFLVSIQGYQSRPILKTTLFVYIWEQTAKSLLAKAFLFALGLF
eukprot:TRINITY_DN15850_c0_g1_i7.p2 TRINITY_DN15850_c0_g1~~TRINITY_DN15850_c0_g1_i7.p2  ORF type:complete len:186 (-),score=-18.34 TRINITY_DN15850_c0_g1_i7:346-903(-)